MSWRGGLWWVALLVIALLAAGVRVGYEAALTGDDGPVGTLHSVLLGDERAYDAFARQVAAGTVQRERSFYQEPLYAWLLAQVYRAFPPSPLEGTPSVVIEEAVHRGIVWSQHGLGVLTVLLVALLGARVLSPAVGLLAGLFAALSGPLVFHEGMLLKETLSLLLLLVALHLWLDALRGAGRGRGLLLGVALGCGILLRGNLYLLLALVLASLVRRWAVAALVLLGAALAIAPATLHNLRRGEFVLTTYQAGTNAVIGQPDNDQVQVAALYSPLLEGRGDAMYEEQDAISLAEKAEGRRLSGPEISRHWWGEWWERTEARPLVTLLRALYKACFTFHGDEVPDVKDWVFMRQAVPWLATPLSDFRWLGPLALLGFLVLPWRRELLVVRGPVLVTLVSLALFYVMGRYRLPAAPGLWILAAAFVVETARYLRERRWLRAGIFVVLGIALAVRGSWPLREDQGHVHVSWSNAASAELHLADLATDVASAGRHRDLAVDFSLRALEISPHYPGGRATLISALDLSTPGLEARGAEAMDQAWRLLLVSEGLRTATDVTPHLSAPLEEVQNLAMFLHVRPTAPGGERAAITLAFAARRAAQDLKRPEQLPIALELCDTSLRWQPEEPITHVLRGWVLRRLGRPAEAEIAYRSALAAGVDSVELHNNFGNLLLSLDRPQEALASFERALLLDPAHPQVLENVGRAQAALQDLQH